MAADDTSRLRRWVWTLLGALIAVVCAARIALYDFLVGDALMSACAFPTWLDYVYFMDRWEGERSADLVMLALGAYCATAMFEDGGRHALRARVIVTASVMAITFATLRPLATPPETTWWAFGCIVVVVELTLRNRVSARRRSAVRCALAVVGACTAATCAVVCGRGWREPHWYWPYDRPTPEVPLPEVLSALFVIVAIHQLFVWRGRHLERALERPRTF